MHVQGVTRSLVRRTSGQSRRCIELWWARLTVPLRHLQRLVIWLLCAFT